RAGPCLRPGLLHGRHDHRDRWRADASRTQVLPYRCRLGAHHLSCVKVPSSHVVGNTATYWFNCGYRERLSNLKRSLVLALATLGTMNAHARAEVVWVGEVIVKTASPSCGTEWLVGDFGSSIFRPVIPGNGENGTVSRL